MSQLNLTNPLRRGLPMRLSTRRAIGTASRWVAAALVIVGLGVVGRMDMEDALEAERMAQELEAAVVALNAKPPCIRLDARKVNPADTTRRQCVTTEIAAQPMREPVPAGKVAVRE